MCNIIHVYKRSYSNAKHTYLGSTKDIFSRKEYFQSRSINVHEVLVKDKTKYDKYLNIDKNIDWKKYDAILMEMTFSPKAIYYVRNRSPRTKIIVRSHNAELLHRIHWAIAEGVSKNAIRYFMQAIRYFYADYLFGKYADAVLCIDEWEFQNYWKRISNKNNIEYVPFYLPRRYEDKLINSEKKDFSCVNFTSSSVNPIISDATKNFIKLISQLDGKADRWKFLITGRLEQQNINVPKNAIRTGWLENPYSVLKEARAMALLSNLGHGFKTKILEAIIAKTYILMPNRLFSRMPDCIKRYCKPVDVKSPNSFLKALDECKKIFPENNINHTLKEAAFKAMDRAILK